jgi:hypothetical protein
MNAINRLGAQIDQNEAIDHLTAAQAMSEAFDQMHMLMEENVRMANALKAIIEYEKDKATATQGTAPGLSVMLGPPACIAMNALLGTTHGNS